MIVSTGMLLMEPNRSLSPGGSIGSAPPSSGMRRTPPPTYLGVPAFTHAHEVTRSTRRAGREARGHSTESVKALVGGQL